ncbi:methyltransferase domain-containing protein [Paraburkholderia sp. NMBU_R16]|uniref:methyltransferase n=1 Tax=Paraburkholderia sp. NMBU_R16 TaxID=2698676 RepID=UPI001562FDC2|nr:methyltransferase [Paraburkholderia sp. NMBU_R16]NRO99448.1 methyltransferase domain-containing protein [Paraburkholderia sp. NMBU_R16]
MLGTACEIGLPDAIKPYQAVAIESVAGILGVNSDALWRMSRTLASFGVFAVDGQRRIAHNDLSLLLRQTGVPSQHWAARFWSEPAAWSAWMELPHVLRSGKEGFVKAHGKHFFDYMNDCDDAASTYRQYMASGYPGRHEIVAASLRLSPGNVVIDVGGNTGALMRAIASHHVGIRGVVYDQSETIRLAETACNQDNLEFVPGNFFEKVPDGGDVYVLSYILHDWPDEQALQILRSCRAAMKPGARLVIVERVLHDDPTRCDPYDLLLDMNMLVLHQGHERTAEQFDALMTQSGFTPIRVRKRHSAFCVAEASVL